MQTFAYKQPFFSLIDQPPDDPSALLRNEIKFEYINADVQKLDNVLKVNNKKVSYDADLSLVNSIYFDDHCLSLFRDNLAGVGRRIKIRLRWYDADLPSNNAFFEIKRRVNNIITKDRFAVNLFRPLSRMSYTEIIDGLLQVLPEPAGELLYAHQQPVVLIRYQRRHYRSLDPAIPVRLTLDDDIVAFDQTCTRFPVFRFKTPLYDRIVLEVKSPVGKEKHITQLLNPLRPRQSRFSKYSLCCSLIGMNTGINESFL